MSENEHASKLEGKISTTRLAELIAIEIGKSLGKNDNWHKSKAPSLIQFIGPAALELGISPEVIVVKQGKLRCYTLEEAAKIVIHLKEKFSALKNVTRFSNELYPTDINLQEILNALKNHRE